MEKTIKSTLSSGLVFMALLTGGCGHTDSTVKDLGNTIDSDELVFLKTDFTLQELSPKYYGDQSFCTDTEVYRYFISEKNGIPDWPKNIITEDGIKVVNTNKFLLEWSIAVEFQMLAYCDHPEVSQGYTVSHSNIIVNSVGNETNDVVVSYDQGRYYVTFSYNTDSEQLLTDNRRSLDSFRMLTERALMAIKKHIPKQ